MTDQEIEEQEIKEGNELIARFRGYVHVERDVMIDNSDCGGIYDRLDVFSKVPIQIVGGGTDQKSFAQLPNPDFGNENNPSWNNSIKTLGWDSLHARNYITNLNYHQDWNQLLEVVDQIESIDEGIVSENNFHFFIGKRYTRVIYDWSTYTTMTNPPKFKSNEEAISWTKKAMKCSSDYRHCIFDEDKKKSTWQAVVDFIKWWNEKQKKD